MPTNFNSTDWYWVVAADSTHVYSSARNVYVDPSTDVDYGNWVTATGGLSPYAAATEAEIWYYTQQWMPAWLWNGTTMSQPAVGQYTKDQLNNYNALQRFNFVNEGMIAAGVPVRTDDYSRNLIQGGSQLALADPTFTTQWYGSDGHWYTVDASQMIEIATTVGNHTNDCYTVFHQVGQGILVNTITQPSQIDDAYVGL
jgi:hypothetical protein